MSSYFEDTTLATAVSVALLVLPAYFGGGVHAALLIPIGLSGIALAAGRAGDLWAGILLLIYSIIGGFSVGIFYVPSAVLFLVAFFSAPAGKTKHDRAERLY